MRALAKALTGDARIGLYTVGPISGVYYRNQMNWLKSIGIFFLNISRAKTAHASCSKSNPRPRLLEDVASP